MKADKDLSKSRDFYHIGAEIILTVIVAPFFIWIVTAIYSLQSSANVDAVKFDQIKVLLERQDQKSDKIIDILINRSHK